MKKIIINTFQIILKKRECLNAIILLLLISYFTSCKKNGAPTPTNNNEVKATVVTSGGTININATATKALMGCASLGGGTYVDGTNASNAAVYISLYASGVMCVTSPGTYTFSCQYRPDVLSPSTPIYVNSGVSDPGSITFTAINDHHMEDYFNAVCRYNTDSVTVNGTFKGDHLTN